MAKDETINICSAGLKRGETEGEMQISVSSIVETYIPLYSASIAVNLIFNIASPDPKIPAENNNLPAISSRPGRIFNHEY